MPKRALGTVLEMDINFSGRSPLHRQLYAALKGAILDGRLRPGSPVPSTRIIAADLRISRTTVLNAFDQLSAEGYLDGRVGSGTRVASCVPGDLAKQTQRNRLRSSHAEARVSQRAHLHPTADLSFLRTSARPLRPGQPESSLFPARTLVAARGQALAPSYARSRAHRLSRLSPAPASDL